MATRVTHHIHYVEIDRLTGPTGGAYLDVYRRAIKVQNGARRRVRVDTGNLRASIHITAPITSGRNVGVRVGSDVDYAPFVGTTDCVSCWGDYLRLALQDAAT
jgi:hypothetical protein